MTRGLNHVHGGDPLRIHAPTWNAILDATRAHQAGRRRAGASPTTPIDDPNLVLVKNASGSDVARMGVLGIDGVLFSEADNSDGFKNGPVLLGDTPDVTVHAGRFVVTVEPIADGKIGRARVAGLTPVKVNLAEVGDEWAEVEDGDATRLLSGPNGSARLLWLASPTGTGEQWALAQIGLAATPRPLDARTSDPSPDPEQYGPGLVLATDEEGRPVIRLDPYESSGDGSGDYGALRFDANGRAIVALDWGVEDLPDGLAVKTADLIGAGGKGLATEVVGSRTILKFATVAGLPAPLSMTVSDPPTQAEVQAIANRCDAITALLDSAKVAEA